MWYNIRQYIGRDIYLMKQDDAPGVIKRAERFQVILIAEGFLVGIVAGAVVLMYRLALEYAGDLLQTLLGYVDGRPLMMAGWLACLVLMACAVSMLVKYEPAISGSGIPQVEGEIAGKLDPKWWRIVLAKFAGGFLCMTGGLALGREGPSIQIGAMMGKGVSKALGRGRTEEHFLLTCGAGAGLAAAFHAPLAGVMFSLEEIHKNFSASLLVSVTTASITADCLCSLVLGTQSVFSFGITDALPLGYYWMIVLLGIFLGVMGAVYNAFTLKIQELYGRVAGSRDTIKIVFAFLCAGILGFIYPELVGSGHDIVESAAAAGMSVAALGAVFLIRFVFSAISFGCGAPGGIFFPLLVLGSLLGASFAEAGVIMLGMDDMYVANFVLLSMAGFFAAVVRAPLTGIILIFEMTGSLDQMLSISIVAITAHIVASLLRSRPIYESLLERFLKKNDDTIYDGERMDGGKVLTEFAVEEGSEAAGKTIGDIDWPKHCLLIAVKRGSRELIPKGDTRLAAGDMVVTMTDERDSAYIRERMEMICSEKYRTS